ncbi:hypothetical protein B7R76_07600 [Mageeibacillus indolicus]|uniref:Uncharacterized protein n=1 Tax=Mageeibacillus indolicus TaxID=884684 RepID=A0A2J8AZB2_9FIRM|nr:hypothetical protein [Mageeibacillus indolicus]PNH17846.1 hypothetical protein B7R76_07600 [Mageeibacillus indolicus]
MKIYCEIPDDRKGPREEEKEREARRKDRKSVEKNARIEKDSDKPIIISPAQFWKKTGKHMSEFGLDAKSIDDRAKFETIVRGIVEGNQELLKGLQWRGQDEPVTAYIKGKDVVLVNSKNEFITILKKVLIMRGLRTKECAKFIYFFEEVQKAAGRCNKVFFLDFGECKDIEANGVLLDDLFGWLVPTSKASEFEKQFLKREPLDAWDDYLVWAIPSYEGQTLTVEFEQ